MAPSLARRPLRLRLTPLAAALAALLPPLASEAAGPVVPPPPAALRPPLPNAVPVPGATWRTYGSGNTSGPVNLVNGRGGVDQTINQTSTKAIYDWRSFDIGAASSVTFDMALPGSSALNRVTGGSTPSQIFGQLKATNSGEVYLINANGILFGRGAVVNTGSLIASGLDITDDNFKSSLLQSITAGADFNASAAFRYAGDAADFVDSRNFVRVDAGATIATSSGGRVFLFAKKVDNAGSITTPDGQTALAAGSEVYLRLPTERALYAAEDNPSVPVLRGLLVEVGDKFRDDTGAAADAHLGSVTNAVGGVISAPRGNATLVGLAVNQLGRVSATTSVAENGTIFLRAQGDAIGESGSNVGAIVPGSGGTLTLGPGSVTEILPDTQLVDGKLPTSNDSAGFIPSRIDLLGKTVELQSGAGVVAPGGLVNLRAESIPSTAFTPILAAQVDPSARVILDAGASIDVSGTTDTLVGVDRYFVTTDLLTSSDLQDSPLQKDGLLYRAKVTVDVREDSLILGDLSRYRATLERTADERMSVGGQVNLSAQGAVLLADGSSINVSGGQIRTTDAMVNPTLLLSSTGGLFNLNDAPPDLLYLRGLNLEKASLTQYDRWGAIADAGATTPAHLEPGYVQGAAAGALAIDAPTVLMNGRLDAHTITGTRQAAGQDALAGMGQLFVGDTAGFGGFDGTDDLKTTTVLGEFSIARTAPMAPVGLWRDPLATDLPEQSGVALQTLADAGFGDITVSAHGDVTLAVDDEWTLADHAALTLQSAQGDVALSGHVTDHAGSVALTAARGRVDVAAGTQVDLTGRWINQFQARLPSDTSAIVGGAFSAQGERGVGLATGSVVDVSGGAAVTGAGSLVGGNAGAITLLAGRTDTDDLLADPVATRLLTLNGTLRGQALQSSKGGSLALRAPSIRIGSSPLSADPAAGLTVDAGFFTRGGFSSYTLDGLAFLDVAAGTTVAPTRTAWWTADTAFQRAPTGSLPGAVLASGASPLLPASTVGLTLKSSGTSGVPVGSAPSVAGGSIALDAGSRIELVPGSAFAAQAASRMDVEGTIVDHGGSVALTTLGSGRIDSAQYLWIGSGATIDVSGTTVLTPSTDGLRHGSVQDGGSITLAAAGDANAYGTSLVLQQGARLDLDGAFDVLDTPTRGLGGVANTRQSVASNGGRLSITGRSDLVLDGDVSMRGGGLQAAGGSLAVALLGARDDFVHVTDPTGAVPAEPPRLTLTNDRTHSSATLQQDELMTPEALAARTLAGTSNATVSAQWVRDSGAADLELDAAHTLRLAGDVALAMPRRLVVDAALWTVDEGAHASLSAATTVIGNTRLLADPNTKAVPSVPSSDAATTGTGTLAIAGTDLILDGRVALRRVGQLTLTATHDLRLQASEALDANVGALDTAADIRIDAGQVYPATGQQFTIAAPDHDVTIAGGDAASAKPLSAGGSLTIAAATIEQNGVLRAPFGSLSLQASERLVLGDGSETSVSGAGLTVSYGQTQNGATTWVAPPSNTSLPAQIDALPGKTLALTAPSLTTRDGATIDLAGGGTVVGYEFIAGPGGSHDVFAGGDGAYAIVPGVQGLSPYDPGITGQAALGTQLVIGPGGPIPAGRYTLLPARYALQPGAFLVKPAGGLPITAGAAIVNPDGSTLIGARTASANTAFESATTSPWRVQTREQALKSSEIRITDAATYFPAHAAANDLGTPRGAADGGVLQFAAGTADLAGTFHFDAARDASGAPTGLGGVAEFSADKIVVANDGTPGSAGTLTLSARQLGAMAPATLVLGGSFGAGTAAGTLAVTAQQVDFLNTDQALDVGDLVAVATDRVEVHAGSAITARAPDPATAAAPVAALAIDGDGAALRVSSQAGASLVRTAGDRTIGTLQVDGGARLDAGAGSLALDGTLSNSIAADATLRAADITLAAGRVLVGAGSAADSLVLSPGLLDQVNNASRLTLRGYERIAFLDDTQLGGNALDSITLDTGRLLAFDATASVTAGEIALVNTTGVVQARGGAGDGSLTLHADASRGSGRLLIGDGALSVNGAQTTTLQADSGLVLGGTATLAVGGDLVVRTPRVLAQAPAAGSASVADVTLDVPGTLNLIGNTPGQAADASTSATGAALTVAAARVIQGTTIDLPSGQLTLGASNGSNGDVTFAANSHTDLAGSTRVIDGTAVSTGGGTLAASALHGDVVAQAGAAIDVSAAGDAGGGSASFTATEGAVQLAGALLGSATDPVRGATLAIDAQAVPSLDALAAIQQAAPGNFGGAVDLRQRGTGALALAAGNTLRANRIALSNDGGALTIAGQLDAGGTAAGSITLAARDDLALQAGGALSAHATGDGASGGRIDLSSAQGRLSLAAGSTVDLGSDTPRQDPGLEGGRLTLRAARVGDTDVAIDAIGAAIKGAAAIDVQAVKVFDGIARLTTDDTDTRTDSLQASTIATDSLAFLGPRGDNADAIASRLGAGNKSLLDTLRIHAEAEVRSSGELEISTPTAQSFFGSDDFVLPTESVDFAATSHHVGDTSLTLRAAGDVTLARTLSAGFEPVLTGFDERMAARTSEHSGNLRVVAGADFGAAATTTTVQGQGTLTIGRDDQHGIPFSDAFDIVAVRATSGNVQLAAGQDINLRTGRAMVYTVGHDAPGTQTNAVRDALFPAPGVYAFTIGAGDVSLAAGGSVLANDVWRDNFDFIMQPQEFSVFRSPITEVALGFGKNASVADAWVLQTSLFGVTGVQHGAFSFGGGRVDVSAGQDIVNLDVVSPSSGYVLRDADGGDPRTTIMPGGDVHVRAGRDIVDGLFETGGKRLSVDAGRDLAWRGSQLPFYAEPGPRLLTENGAIDATARRDLTVGYVQSAFTTQGQALTGMDADASARLQAAGGGASLLASLDFDNFGNSQAAILMPARLSITAPYGSLVLGDTVSHGLQPSLLEQLPTSATSFELLAGDAIDLAQQPGLGVVSISLGGTPDLSDGPQLASTFTIVPTTPLDNSDRTPAHIATATGDITLPEFATARPLRVDAGHDLVLLGPVSVTHQPERLDGPTPVPVIETSSLQAGRDVRVDGTNTVSIAGPGEFLVLAGRDVNLGSGTPGIGDLAASGILATGNTINDALPVGAANVTVVAGLRADGSDYDQATLAGFAAIGANALTDHAGDLYAQLTSTGTTAVALGTAAASAFDAASVDTRLAQVSALLGTAVYDARLAAYVRTLPGQSALTDAQALAAFAALSTVARDAAPGVLLAQSFTAQPQATRDSFVAQIAAATPGTYGSALVDYMARLDGRTRTLTEALADFEALPLTSRIPLLDVVLVDEMRSNGRAAAAATGSVQENAYDRGYRTIAALFPVDRPGGDIEMPLSIVKTDQQASITLLAPGGGVDGGGIASSEVSPNNLGVVTVAGGDISSVVRDDFLVNRSRVFTLGPGNVLIWSSDGNIDAGRGAKSVVGAPAPVLRIDPGTGQTFLDTSGSFTGSGIAVLDADSTLDLYAPAGAIDAGEAGIRSAGDAFFAAQVFIGTDNLQVGGHSVGAPPPVSAVGATAQLANATNVLANAQGVADDDREERRKRRTRRSLLLEFLGFGNATN